jgi:hypothetical protein
MRVHDFLDDDTCEQAMANEIPITNPAAARAIIRHRLRDHSAETVEIATLLASELVANALEHGEGTPTLALEVNQSQLCAYVHDDDPTQDLTPLPNDPTRERGRGLAIVDALATQWGVEPRWRGKTVWFALHLSARAARCEDPVQLRDLNEAARHWSRAEADELMPHAGKFVVQDDEESQSG